MSPTLFLCPVVRSVSLGCSHRGQLREADHADRIVRLQRRHDGGALVLAVLRSGRPEHLLVEIGDRFTQRHFPVFDRASAPAPNLATMPSKTNNVCLAFNRLSADSTSLSGSERDEVVTFPS